MGRCDRQVKIRGYRIEIEEIEMCIGRFEGISEAVVIVHGEGDDKTLYAYIVVKKRKSIGIWAASGFSSAVSSKLYDSSSIYNC